MAVALLGRLVLSVWPKESAVTRTHSPHKPRGRKEVSRITQEEVRRVARLAQLSLSDGEVETLRADLDAILDYVEQLSTLDLEGVEPTTHAVPLEMPQRADTVVKTLTRQEVLQNAPVQTENMFEVPRTVEGGN